MQSLFFRTTTVAALLLSTSSLCFAGGVRIVERTGTQNFADIQSAVTVAPDGAVLLVGAGTYPGFSIAGKSLSVFGVPGATVSVQGGVDVSADAGKTVVLGGLNFHPNAGTGAPALNASGAGFLRFQDCQFYGADFPYDGGIYCYGGGGPGEPGPPGAHVSGCSRIAFERCSFRGGRGENNDDTPEYNCEPWQEGGGHGGPGLFAEGSRVVLYDCTLTGGVGGGATQLAGPGGDGVALASTSLLASQSTFTGGWGGQHYMCCDCFSAGGAGCSLVNGSAASAVESDFVGGEGGGVLNNCYATLTATNPVVGGDVQVLPGAARIATITPSVGSDASTWTVSFQNAPNDRVYFPAATLPDFVTTGHGAWLEYFRTPESALFLGTAGAAGTLTATPATPDLVPGPLDPICQLTYAQVASNLISDLVPNHRHPRPWFSFEALGSSSVLVVIDRNSLPDCNGNGVNDFVEVLEGTAADANDNLIPDGCPGG